MARFLGHLAEDFQATPERRGIDIVWVKAHTDENYAFMRDTDNPMQLAMTYNLEAEAQLAEKGSSRTLARWCFSTTFRWWDRRRGSSPSACAPVPRRGHRAGPRSAWP